MQNITLDSCPDFKINFLIYLLQTASIMLPKYALKCMYVLGHFHFIDLISNVQSKGKC